MVDTGGAWSEDEALYMTGLTLEELRESVDARKILAVPDDEGTIVYPAALFLTGQRRCLGSFLASLRRTGPEPAAAK